MRAYRLILAVALLALSLAGYQLLKPVTPIPPTVTPSSEVSAEGISRPVSNLPVQCKQSGINCVEGWNGTGILLYSGAGTGQTFYADGATGNVTTTGTLAVGTWLRPEIQTTINVTTSATFTPTGTFQPVAATLWVTPTLSRSGFASGSQLVLYNNSEYTVTVAVSPTNAVIVPFRAVSLVFDGTYWVRK